MAARYCDVALPVPLRSTFTYAVPPALDGESLVGRRVVVPFGRRAMIGVGLSESDSPPDIPRVKEIAEVMDSLPALPPKLIELGHWISRYYLAPVGETFRAMLPPEIELRHNREYSLTDSGRDYLRDLSAAGELTDQEQSELALLQRLEGAASHPRKKRVNEIAAEKLVRLGYLSARDVVRHRKTRMQQIVAWRPGTAELLAGDAEKKIREVLTATRGPLPLALLLEKANASRAVARRLEKAGMLVTWEEPLTPGEDPWDTDFVPPANVLNAEQKIALAEIWRWLLAGEFAAGLIHGVTGSGKTEVYLGAIEAALSRGKTAIVLVPEIALTLWVGRLVRARFGEGVVVLHSGLPDIERAREWWRVRRGEARVVVGTRSAVFAPLENLGLIIVDEEQESSYKQEETPRYNGRDTAVYRARLEGAAVLLGSATPSLETYHNARAGKYHLLKLTSRVENRPLAEVRIVDLREDFRRQHRAAPISEALRAAIALRLEERTQAMVLINRRGYSWSLMCRGCGAMVQCQNCSIALTYHKSRQRLECHYCGYSLRPPKQCPKCRAEYMYFVGDGAERVDEYLREQFPAARIARLDRDTVRTKREYQQVLGAFAKGELDVLVGTQMVAKGHDFRACHSCRRCRRRSRARPPGFPRRRTHFPIVNAGRWPRGSRRVSWRSSRRNVLSRTLRDSICRPAGLHFVLRQGSALPARAALSAVHRARHRARARPQSRERDSLVARAGRIFRAIRKTRREDSRPRRCAARAPAPRLPLSIRAEIAAPLRARKSPRRRARILRREGIPRDRCHRGRGSHQFILRENP